MEDHQDKQEIILDNQGTLQDKMAVLHRDKVETHRENHVHLKRIAQDQAIIVIKPHTSAQQVVILMNIAAAVRNVT